MTRAGRSHAQRKLAQGARFHGPPTSDEVIA